MDLENVACVLHGLAEKVTLWEITAWEVVGFLRVGFNWNDQSQNSPLSKGWLLEFPSWLWPMHSVRCQRLECVGRRRNSQRRRKWQLWAGCYLGAIHVLCRFCPLPLSPQTDRAARAVHTKPGKPRAALSTWDGAAPLCLVQRDMNFSWPLWEFLAGDYCTQPWCFNTSLEPCLENADFCIAVNYQTCSLPPSSYRIWK